FIVGENHSGVRSVTKLLPDLAVQKIDSARRCSLFHFTLSTPISCFELADWWHQYNYQSAIIKALPGVFSRNELDEGSRLLIAAMHEQQSIITGRLLDMGCGAGVLSVAASLLNPALKLTLVDVSA